MRLLLLIVMSAAAASGQRPTSEQLEFFETRIRPVLVDRCYACHNAAERDEGALELDHRAGLLEGGVSGPAIVPGDASKSLLIRAIRHDGEAPRMPEDNAKLPARVIADFTRWIDDGAHDPRDTPPSAKEIEAATSWEAVRERRMKWWSFQPVRPVKPPAGEGHPIDRFLAERLKAAGLGRAPRADRRTQLRRLHLVVTGLPPSRGEIDAFLADESPNAWSDRVHRLLSSPRFGERWARHWMDWMRYADSHGSEGDPSIPYAWRYRDYLIDAINEDVSWYDLVIEHVAGDRLERPRMHEEWNYSRSAFGVAHYRLIQHGFSPTDAHEERVRNIDDQIDALTKAFLGLTVSCARCHDHKFDPISQRDYYALYGILAPARPTVLAQEIRRGRHGNRRRKALKARVKRLMVERWREAVADVPARLRNVTPGKRSDVLDVWKRLMGKNAERFEREWGAALADHGESLRRLREQDRRTYAKRWNLRTGPPGADWIRRGEIESVAAGEFRLHDSEDRVIGSILPRGVYSSPVSTRSGAVLSSPEFDFDMKAIWVRVLGDGGSPVRYAPRAYPRGGTIYPIHRLHGGRPQWVRWDTTYWSGDRGYVEISTAADQAVEANVEATRSWWGITDTVFVDDAGEGPRDEPAEWLEPLFRRAGDEPPTSEDDLAELYRDAVSDCITAWASEDGMTDAEALFLDGVVRHGLLPNDAGDESGIIARVVREYRRIEPHVIRSPGIMDATPQPTPLFVRGDHREPGEIVPRRFLEALDPTPYPEGADGRLSLARDLVGSGRRLMARVAVNRIWHHVFGRGIVSTPDNFGHLGARPSHPELLDWLANRFDDFRGSIKTMLHVMLTSETFRAGSRPPKGALEVDPDNVLLSRFRPRRLDAEAIRDTLLSVSGRLDGKMYGPPAGGGSSRRSVYVRVKRNALDPFLSVFDAPVPDTTRGVRASTTTPAQALTMMNGDLVRESARALAARVARPDVPRMFETVLGRPPTGRELALAGRFLERRTEDVRTLAAERRRIDADLASARRRRDDLLERARSRLLLQKRGNAARAPRPVPPEPIARWGFETDLRDSVGALHGTARGRARVEAGALVLDGESFVLTPPLARDLREKSLEVRVTLDDLDQRGGGVMTVETNGGAVFDSIVIGEQQVRHWLPGSDNFRRTQRLGGSVETGAHHRPVHLVMVYGADGTITAYRDGAPYGRSYRSDGPVTYRAGDGRVLFGLRHSPGRGGRYLRGRLHEARLYDRALTAEQVAAKAREDREFVSQDEVIASLTEHEGIELVGLDVRLARLAADRPDIPEGWLDGDRAWEDLAHSLLDLKELIYLR